MTKSPEAAMHWYPAAVAGQRPSAWWYWGRAVYVSRRDYWKITKYFLAVGIPLGAIGVLFRLPLAFWAAVALAEIGLLLLEVPPTNSPRIVASKTEHFTLPLQDASCDAVCFGFGTHEIPIGGAREKLFGEAMRVLKPGGKVLLFEHGWDAHNYVIFGPVIHHVTRRQDWDKFLEERFNDVKYARSSQAVDLFAGTRR
ncbi:MAG: hypothetical protein DMG54_21205 [Acidobacteria bacterium]|nr:MAG: hypothetical protein DMG54_21205 [Acidobacteriota bacterium]